MQYLKLSDFLNLKEELPFLLGVFFSRYKFSNDLIYTLSTYRLSKFVQNGDKIIYENSKIEYLNQLNLHSEIPMWQLNKDKKIKHADFVFVLYNDLKLTQEQFFARIYTKILLSDFVSNHEAIKARKKFIRAFFELRGSVDINHDYFTHDYYFNNINELKRISLFLDNFGMSINLFNINFRYLQKQYLSGVRKRNTQLRINLHWYLSQIGFINGFINKYKANIVKNALNISYFQVENIFMFNCQSPSINKNSFNKRIDFYSTRILSNDLTQCEVSKLRKELNFDDDESQIFKRNLNIINIIKFQTPDECAACKHKYNIVDRSFLTRKDRYYTEIHHFVSVGKNKELDVLENLTKLCPICHRALGVGKASENYQKELIKNILDTNSLNYEFASMIFESKDKDFLIQRVYENLK
ncbi:HNH endonuclease [Campylobacter sp. LR286c]|uniref:HNH endonuclease n=1 Tax=Campylobacter sp. LR286c TaxID=2593545 RepID=UPI001237B9A2|nr:HNH endonuclease [Campylobacter sp. LR286c]KAA6228993.1 HNH endonuclease [Campylobacter sp. LR286c]